ncbi:MAG: leucyl aminopeptidase family protein, partial [Proteobacteria bacterium]|nr:leucyl aminopeptidase family protein [Pseudomonadota bacterium]
DKKTDKHLVLVGKGVTFDTGGHNLKSASGMFGMHRDMAGSALAYGVIALAAKEKWPIRVTAFLAIAENAIGPNAYKQNDVVTAMNGKTIEIVDTDAEGRMLLADALQLASLEKPQLLLDFATLTGACIRALSTIYSGVFTNRMELLQTLINAGRESGERVWPFPLDADFAEALKSDIADIKQCRVSGGVDHIEAALFLKEFVAKDLTWVHVDLAAAEHTGGLAHIDTEVTGFGLRFVSQFVRMHWDSCNNLHQRGL